MKKWNLDPKHRYNFIYRNTKFSPKKDLLGSFCRIMESFRLEKTFKIIKSNREPNTTKSTTKPCC